MEVLSDSKSLQVSRTLLSILADFNSTAVWVVSILPLIFSSFSLLFKNLGTILRTHTTIGITVTLIFHNSFNSLAIPRHLSIFSLAFIFTLCYWNSKIHQMTSLFVFFFLLNNIWSGLLVKIGWSICISMSQRIIYISPSRTDSGLCIELKNDFCKNSYILKTNQSLYCFYHYYY